MLIDMTACSFLQKRAQRSVSLGTSVDLQIILNFLCKFSFFCRQCSFVYWITMKLDFYVSTKTWHCTVQLACYHIITGNWFRRVKNLHFPTSQAYKGEFISKVVNKYILLLLLYTIKSFTILINAWETVITF